MAIITCPQCGAKNRVDETAAQTQQPICGHCKTRLPVPDATSGGSSHPQVVTDGTFQQLIQGAGQTPVLLDCWAAWCGPCRMLAPTLDQLAAESGGRFIIAKLNTDENPRVAQQYRIEALPTMLLFRNGQVVDRIVGLQPKQAIERKLLSQL